MSRVRRRKAVKLKRSKQVEYSNKIKELNGHRCNIPENREYSRSENVVIDIGFKHGVFDDSINESFGNYED